MTPELSAKLDAWVEALTQRRILQSQNPLGMPRVDNNDEWIKTWNVYQASKKDVDDALESLSRCANEEAFKRWIEATR